MGIRKVAKVAAYSAVVATASAGIFAGAMFTYDKVDHQGFKENVVFPIINYIGEKTGVNTDPDKTYTDFYVAGFELVTNQNVHYSEMEKLRKADPNGKFYLIRAARDNDDKTVRTFVVSEKQANGMGLLDPGIKQGDGLKIILPKKKFSFPALGQYLRNTQMDFLNFDVFPMAQDIIASPGNPAEVTAIEDRLRRNDIDESFRTQRRFDPTKAQPD